MQRILLILITGIMNTVCLYSQILPYLTEVELLKGKVKKIETTYYPSGGKRSKEVSEYDSLGRITSKINYYIKTDSHKEYFAYDSIGSVVLHIYETNEYSHQYIYEYKYDDKGRRITQLELRDGKLLGGYDSVVYNKDNLPIQYLVKRPYSSIQFFIQYFDGIHNEKTRHIEKKTDLGEKRGIINSIIEELRMYNDHGFPAKEKRETITHYPSKEWDIDIRIDVDELPNPSKHSEEYDYVDYKYDKQGNWIERKTYLNWEKTGRELYLKEKRKIEYYR